ncbi:MAG: DUF4838 domain-containing protein [Ruminococcaceae bacterium]|nr:DUF4838 domain-containing protein [Oscillospiraceae bacterium]
MKKILSVVLMLAMLLSTCAVFASVAPVAAVETTAGDLNNDGNINAIDSLLMRKYVSGVRTSDLNEAAADLNGDGSINAKDIVIIKQYLAGVTAALDGKVVDKAVTELTIAGEDISKYEIVVLSSAPEGYWANENYQYAGRQLRNFISDAVGYTLNIVNSASANKKHIYLDFDTSGAHKEEGYSWIVNENGDFHIVGGTRRGCMYGVFNFIKEYLGFRAFEYDTDYFLPQGKVNVPAGLNHKYIPQFTYRDVHTWGFVRDGGGDDTLAWLCIFNGINSHTDRPSVSNAKYGWADGNVWINAHSFQYIFGIGAGEQPCLAPSNWMNLYTCTNWWRSTIEERFTWHQSIGQELTRISVSWNDNENYCWCAECKSVYQAEKSVAGTITRFANAVAADIRSTWDLEIYYIAYGSARIPPILSRPNDGVVVCYCWNGCNNHTFGSDDCSDYGNTMGFTNWEERYYFEAWSKITDKLFVWYYAYNFYYFVSPCPNILNLREDMRYLAEHGVDGVYLEGNGDSNKGFSFEPLKDYMMAQVAWDPYMSEGEFQQHINEFLEHAYGEGWGFIKEYLYLADEAGDRAGCFTCNYDWPGNMYDLTFMYENLDTITNLFESAKATSASGYHSRIDSLSIHAYWLALCGGYIAKGGSISSDATLKAVYDNMYSLMQNHGFRIGVYYSDLPAKNYGVSPILNWFELEVLSGRWEDWYSGPGQRPNPADDPKHPVNLNRYITADLNRYENPYDTLIP